MADPVMQRLLESLEREANQYRIRCDRVLGRALHEQWKDFEIEREGLHSSIQGLRTGLRVLITNVRECIARSKAPDPWMANEAETDSERIAKIIGEIWIQDPPPACIDHPDAIVEVMGRDPGPSCSECGKRVGA